MGRPAGPWPRKSDGWWYATIDGIQTKLIKGGPEKKGEAYKIFYRLKGQDGPSGKPDVTIRELADAHSHYKQKGIAPDTNKNYRRYLDAFIGHVGEDAVAECIEAKAVLAWVNRPSWGPTTRRLVLTIIKTLYSWGLEQKVLRSNPMLGVKRPSPRAREMAMDKVLFSDIIAAVRDRCFRDFLAIMYETGCRPSEAMRLRRDHIDFAKAKATMKSKTTARTGRERVIQLTPKALELCRQLAERQPTGPILRSRGGKPWNRDSVCSRFYRLRKKLGLPAGTCAETIRHGWITDALVAGVPIATVAALAGHVDPTMVSRVYSKLHERTDHLQEELKKIRP